MMTITATNFFMGLMVIYMLFPNMYNLLMISTSGGIGIFIGFAIIASIIAFVLYTFIEEIKKKITLDIIREVILKLLLSYMQKKADDNVNDLKTKLEELPVNSKETNYEHYEKAECPPPINTCSPPVNTCPSSVGVYPPPVDTCSPMSTVYRVSPETFHSVDDQKRKLIHELLEKFPTLRKQFQSFETLSEAYKSVKALATNEINSTMIMKLHELAINDKIFDFDFYKYIVELI